MILAGFVQCFEKIFIYHIKHKKRNYYVLNNIENYAIMKYNFNRVLK
jgi:hypothetical protein